MPSLRDQFFIDPDVIFLNHGSYGATPRPVFESYQHWQMELERQPVKFFQRRAHDLLIASRSSLAEYLGTHMDNLALVMNVTVGLNIVSHSLDLGSGDEVLTSDHEYGSMDGMWRVLAHKRGFQYINREIPLPIQDTAHFVDSFWQGVTPHTRVIFLSHYTSPTAIIFPIKEICQRARQAGIMTVIDGAHAPGQIPLALDDLGADFYSGNLHKWLCTPKGVGFLFARPEMQNLIEPLIITGDWRNRKSSEPYFSDMLQYNGTRDLAAFLTVPDAIRFQRENDWSAVQRSCHELGAETRRRIHALSGLPALCPDSMDWYAQMGTALMPEATDIGKLYTLVHDQRHIEIPLFDWKGYKIVRFSFQAYNSHADVDALVGAVEDFIKSQEA